MSKMKLLFIPFILIVTLSCAPTNLPPSDITNEEVEQANTIILIVDKTPEQAYREIAQHLMDKGFAFSNTDNTLLTISTESNDLGYMSHSISLNVSVRELDQTAIYIRGNVHSSFLGNARISNVGSGSSIYRAAWDDMKGIAKEFSYDEFLYKRD